MPRKVTPKKEDVSWHDAFISALRASGVVRLACHAAGIARKTAYAHRERDPDFRAAWDDALEDGVDVLVAEARKRAVGSSDTLLIFLLKAHRPAVYRDNYRPPEPVPDFDLDADIRAMTTEERAIYQLKVQQYIAKVRATGRI